MSAEHTTRADRYYDNDYSMQRRRAAASSLGRRSRVLWVLIWGCAVIVVVLVITFMFYAGLFESGGGTKVLKRGEISESVNAGDLKFTGFDKKNQAYTITANSADQDDTHPNIIHLNQVKAEMKLSGSGDVINVTADRGTYDTETETVRLDDNIKLTSTGGFTAELSTAEVLLKKGRVHSEKPVVVHMSKGTIWSNAVDLWERGKRIVFKDRVRVVFEVKAEDADAE